MPQQVREDIARSKRAPVELVDSVIERPATAFAGVCAVLRPRAVHLAEVCGAR
jgi:hypothetical protein